MLIRYDFSKEPDLAALKKQMLHYIPLIKDITYHFLLKDYRIVTHIAENSESRYSVALYINDIVRDAEGEIIKHNEIIPLSDIRFKDIHRISDMFCLDLHEAEFTVDAVEPSVDVLIGVIKIVSRINRLKVFL